MRRVSFFDINKISFRENLDAKFLVNLDETLYGC